MVMINWQTVGVKPALPLSPIYSDVVSKVTH